MGGLEGDREANPVFAGREQLLKQTLPLLYAPGCSCASCLGCRHHCCASLSPAPQPAACCKQLPRQAARGWDERAWFGRALPGTGAARTAELSFLCCPQRNRVLLGWLLAQHLLVQKCTQKSLFLSISAPQVLLPVA